MARLHSDSVTGRNSTASKIVRTLPVHRSLPADPDNRWACFACRLFRNVIELESYSTQPTQPTQPFQTGFSLRHVCLRFMSLQLRNIPLSGWTTVCLYVRLPKDILVAEDFFQHWFS